MSKAWPVIAVLALAACLVLGYLLHKEHAERTSVQKEADRLDALATSVIAQKDSVILAANVVRAERDSMEGLLDETTDWLNVNRARLPTADAIDLKRIIRWRNPRPAATDTASVLRVPHP